MTIVLKAVVLFVATFRLQLFSKISAEAMISSRSVRIAPSHVECDDCELRGDITFGRNNEIHPKVIIIAESGPIRIGHNNTFEEGAVIINRLSPGESPSSTTLRIGNNNVFKAGSHSEALRIQNYNVFESKCFVGRCVELADYCVVGTASMLTCLEE